MVHLVPIKPDKVRASACMQLSAGSCLRFVALALVCKPTPYQSHVLPAQSGRVNAGAGRLQGHASELSVTGQSANGFPGKLETRPDQ